MVETRKDAANGLIRDVLATDGVKYFFEEAQAWWLFDLIAIRLRGDMRRHGFLHIRFEVEGSSGVLIVTDGSEEIRRIPIDFTDAPEGVWEFYFTDNVLLLPGEY